MLYHFKGILKRLITTLVLLIVVIKAYSSDTLEVSDAARFLSSYVSIPSVSGQEEEAAQWFAGEFAKKGFFVEYITNSPGSVNFTASLYPLSLGKPNIIFLNHIDVVTAGNAQQWRYPPYDGVIAEGKVWGRGSFDNKGLGVIQMYAVSEFLKLASETDLKYNVTVLCVSGEETGGITGSSIVAKDFIERLNPEVVIGEGGSGMEELSFMGKKGPMFGISIAEKGCMLVKLSWHTGDGGHASIAGDSYASLVMINTLYRLLNTPHPIVMTKEAELMFSSVGKKIGGVKGKVMSKPTSKLFMRFLKQHALENPELNDIMTNKITLTGISSNKTSYNQVSHEVAAFLDCRLLPGESPEDIISFIRDSARDSLMHISIIEQGPMPLTTEPEYYFNLMASALEEEFEGSNVVPMLLPASTDNSYFRATGVPVYGINPMIVSQDQLNAIHSYNEFIKLADIDRGIVVFTKFLNKVLGTNQR